MYYYVDEESDENDGFWDFEDTGIVYPGTTSD